MVASPLMLLLIKRPAATSHIHFGGSKMQQLFCLTRSAWACHHPSVIYLDVMSNDEESSLLGCSVLKSCDESTADFPFKNSIFFFFSLDAVIECWRATNAVDVVGGIQANRAGEASITEMNIVMEGSLSRRWINPSVSLARPAASDTIECGTTPRVPRMLVLLSFIILLFLRVNISSFPPSGLRTPSLKILALISIPPTSGNTKMLLHFITLSHFVLLWGSFCRWWTKMRDWGKVPCMHKYLQPSQICTALRSYLSVSHHLHARSFQGPFSAKLAAL